MRSLGRGSRTWWLIHLLGVCVPGGFALLALVLGVRLSLATWWILPFPVMLFMFGLPLVQLRIAFAHRKVHGEALAAHGMELNVAGMRACWPTFIAQ